MFRDRFWEGAHHVLPKGKVLGRRNLIKGWRYVFLLDLSEKIQVTFIFLDEVCILGKMSDKMIILMCTVA